MKKTLLKEQLSANVNLLSLLLPPSEWSWHFVSTVATCLFLQSAYFPHFYSAISLAADSQSHSRERVVYIQWRFHQIPVGFNLLNSVLTLQLFYIQYQF